MEEQICQCFRSITSKQKQQFIENTSFPQILSYQGREFYDIYCQHWGHLRQTIYLDTDKKLAKSQSHVGKVRHVFITFWSQLSN